MDIEKAKFLCASILDAAVKKGAEYADIRMTLCGIREKISVNGGLIEPPIIDQSFTGLGIRVLVDKHWGFASMPNMDQPQSALIKNCYKALRQAIDISESASKFNKFTTLAPLDANVAPDFYWETRVEIDPFKIPLKEKIEILLAADSAMARTSNRISTRYCEMNFWDYIKLFASIENGKYRFVSQRFRGSGGGIFVYASDGNEIQSRSFQLPGGSAGYEKITSIDWIGTAERTALEAEELLRSPDCPEDEMDIILLPDQLGLHVHETGHGFEAGRIFGYEDTYMGGTMISEMLPYIGEYEFGSACLNIVADATLPGGYGTFVFDDEGVPAKKFYLVRDGILENLLTCREITPRLNELLGHEYFSGSNGAMRSFSFSRTPLIRMTNISLMPQDYSLLDLISMVDNGIILETPVSWSMSEDRKNFDFGLERGTLIKDGKLAGIVKNPGYRGNNIHFWHSLAAVASSKYWRIIDIPNCGKGHPAQYMAISHGSSPSLFTDIDVYNRKMHSIELLPKSFSKRS